MVSLYGRAIGDLQKDFIDGKSKILTCEKSSYLEVTVGLDPTLPSFQAGASRCAGLCLSALFFPFVAAFAVWLLGCVLPFVTL